MRRTTASNLSIDVPVRKIVLLAQSPWQSLTRKKITGNAWSVWRPKPRVNHLRPRWPRRCLATNAWGQTNHDRRRQHQKSHGHLTRLFEPCNARTCRSQRLHCCRRRHAARTPPAFAGRLRAPPDISTRSSRYRLHQGSLQGGIRKRSRQGGR